jgi:serine/threonine protein kinase
MTVSTGQALGTRIGSFEIVRQLGSGGMGEVHEARHVTLGKRVAIKILHRHLLSDHVATERFLREGRAASAIRHPNILEVFEIGTYQGSPYLVIELLEGEDLASLLQRGPLQASDAVDILVPTASAVAAAHAVGVIHRDLTPRNLFLAAERRADVRPKVLDFGMSKLSRSGLDAELTQSGTLLGTLDYMAPEQARNAKDASERSDQYALGVILYECVTGKKPFAGTSAYELLHAIVTAPFATPRSVGATVDPRLEAIILRAMQRDPGQRFESVQAFGRSLLPFASEHVRRGWHADFEASVSRADSANGSPSSSPPYSPLAVTSSLLGATLPESKVPGRSRAPAASLRSRALLVGGLIVVAVAAVLANRVIDRGRRVPTEPVVAQTEANPTHSVAPPSPPLAELTPLDRIPPQDPAPARAVVPVVASSAAPVRPRDPTRAAARVAAAPPAPSAPPPAEPAARKEEPPVAVERGFNGAPILR